MALAVRLDPAQVQASIRAGTDFGCHAPLGADDLTGGLQTGSMPRRQKDNGVTYCANLRQILVDLSVYVSSRGKL